MDFNIAATKLFTAVIFRKLFFQASNVLLLSRDKKYFEFKYPMDLGWNIFYFTEDNTGII